MADLIDRQAAIYAAREELESGTYFDIPSKIEALPAAQPDHNADIGKKVSISCGHEDDLISRQMAIDAVGDWIYNPEDLRYHKDVINSIPAVQPEIIRCKDCKYWRDDHTCHEHSLVSPMCANEYCSRAERRTDE